MFGAAAFLLALPQINANAEVLLANAAFLALSPKLKLRGKLHQAFTDKRPELWRHPLAKAGAEPGKRVALEAIFDNAEPRAIVCIS